MIHSAIRTCHNEVPELEVTKPVLQLVELCECRIFVLEQEWADEHVINNGWFIDQRYVAELIEDLRGEDLSVLTVIEVVIANDDVDWNSEGVQLLESLLGIVHRHHVD